MGILIKPIITEKQNLISEKMPNRYGFRVAVNANKHQIKTAVEEMYNVKVVSVNTMNYSGKRKVRYTKGGVIAGRSNAYKKAVVTLADDQSIDFYSNI